MLGWAEVGSGEHAGGYEYEGRSNRTRAEGSSGDDRKRKFRFEGMISKKRTFKLPFRKIGLPPAGAADQAG